MTAWLGRFGGSGLGMAATLCMWASTVPAAPVLASNLSRGWLA